MKKAERGELYYESLPDSARRKVMDDFEVGYEYNGRIQKEKAFYMWLSDNFRFNVKSLKNKYGN